MYFVTFHHCLNLTNSNLNPKPYLNLNLSFKVKRIGKNVLTFQIGRSEIAVGSRYDLNTEKDHLYCQCAGDDTGDTNANKPVLKGINEKLRLMNR